MTFEIQFGQKRRMHYESVLIDQGGHTVHNKNQIIFVGLWVINNLARIIDPGADVLLTRNPRKGKFPLEMSLLIAGCKIRPGKLGNLLAILEHDGSGSTAGGVVASHDSFGSLIEGSFTCGGC